MMKKLSALLVALSLALSLGAQVKGPIIDKILLDAKTQQDIALKDVATGKSDMFNYNTDGAAYKALPDDVKASLTAYDNTGSSYISLYLNPFPNKAPYQGTVDGKVSFNPFAIREVRFAINFLINRKQIIDEIMVGAGVPMFTPVTPGQPNSSRFGFAAAKFGFTATGNEKKAIADITAAMQAAANLPENKGRLVKGAQWWTFDGQPVTVKFLIRVDDPTVRLPEGRYVADQIEKAGIKVDRLEWDRTRCRQLWDKSDPAELGWHIYTEGWGGGQTNAFFETNIAQMAAPWYGSMPGGNKEGFWSYTNDELDNLTQDCVNGRVKDSAEYYAKLLKANELGLREAVRIWVSAQTVYYCVNKDRFNGRFVTGAGDGINKFSFYTADVKPDKDGQKILRETVFSARGALFMSAWDPIGPDGASDTYSQAVVQVLGDPETIANPVTGIPIPMRASWKGLKTDISVTDKITGKIPVPKDAVLWNARTQKWESGIVFIDVNGDGQTYDYKKASTKADYGLAWSMATFTFRPVNWQHGRALTQADYRYALSRPYDLCVKRGPDDKIYEESYASAISPNLPRFKGYVFNKDGTITVYGDVNYPMDQPSLAALLCPTLMIEGSGYGTYVPWEIHEACKFLVSEGSASKTVYTFNSNGDFSEIDLISQKCVADIKAKLQELIARKYVPESLKGFVTPEQAVKGYQDAIAFIDKHGHAYISNGGFVLDRYDPANNTAVLAANRDPGYPFEKGYFTKILATSFARVDAIRVPTYKKGAGLTVNVTVSEVAFPANTSKPAAKANVKVTLVGDKETVYTAKATAAGAFEVQIPAKDLDVLKPGAYTIVVEAALGSEAGAVDTANLIVF
jgi:peptide/nickel transport system substrate-binding protein